MLFKLDENLPESLVADLTAAGHDAATAVQENLAGKADPTIAGHAIQENRIVATFDLDFSDIRRYPPGNHPGIVVFRLRSQDIASCHAAFARLLANVAAADFAGNLIIVEDRRIRIRRPNGTP
jgi:predicted nuclease of predicted toxin-antitoxin system